MRRNEKKYTTAEYKNNQEVDQAARIDELMTLQGPQGRDVTYRWAEV